MNLRLATGVLFATAIFGCTQISAQKVQHVDPQEFQDLMKTQPKKIILDVRTPGEFESGHIPGAVNVNISGDDFTEQIAKLDTSTPVFVYCLAGGRSASATEVMTDMGFKQIVDLKSGIMKWNAMGFPVDKGAVKASHGTGMTEEEFNKITAAESLTLVDFSAKWCTPCRAIKNYLGEIKSEYGSKVAITEVDYDDNSALIEKLKITTVPFLRIYRSGKVVWEHEGAVEKQEIVTELNKLLK